MSSALAPIFDVEPSTEGSTVTANITVNAFGPVDLPELWLSSDNPKVVVGGETKTKITLRPDSSTPQPVIYILTFTAGDRVASFQTPVVRTWLDHLRTAAYIVNPSSDGLSFGMSFVNNLPEQSPPIQPISLSFFIDWFVEAADAVDAVGAAGAAEVQRKRSEDPTIILDPPNS